jgi:tryptophan synthase beta chain
LTTKNLFGPTAAGNYDEYFESPIDGWFGNFGGQFVPELLVGSLKKLEKVARECFEDPVFLGDLEAELKSWAGRPTALTRAKRLGQAWGAEVWLKREDLTHTGAHKINNVAGQIRIAERLGAKRIIAETGAGQHGVATAAACARQGIPCTVYMGEVDVVRQQPNVQRMKLFGAEVIQVTSGDRTLRAAINETLRDWASDPLDTYYLLGSAVGPHPYPWIVRTIQSVIGRGTKDQLAQQTITPDSVVAAVGGGSNAIGMFHPFIPDTNVTLLGVEAAGGGISTGKHAATISEGRPGVLHGTLSMLLQTDEGQIQETHSISAGLDYPGVGPEHAMLHQTGRASYTSVTDDEAIAALNECCRLEGILPAIESAHALAGAQKLARERPGQVIVVCLSGRGDKDLDTLTQRGEMA